MLRSICIVERDYPATPASRPRRSAPSPTLAREDSGTPRPSRAGLSPPASRCTSSRVTRVGGACARSSTAPRSGASTRRGRSARSPLLRLPDGSLSPPSCIASSMRSSISTSSTFRCRDRERRAPRRRAAHRARHRPPRHLVDRRRRGTDVVAERGRAPATAAGVAPRTGEPRSKARCGDVTDDPAPLSCGGRAVSYSTRRFRYVSSSSVRRQAPCATRARSATIGCGSRRRHQTTVSASSTTPPRCAI